MGLYTLGWTLARLCYDWVWEKERKERALDLKWKKEDKKETPDESRKIFEEHVKEAAKVVATENSSENTRTT